MAKSATEWRTQSGYDTVTSANTGFALLLEDGDNLLLETGDNLLLEDNVITPKNSVDWSDTSKNVASWEDDQGYNTQSLVSDTLDTESGNARVTEHGTARSIETVTTVGKSAVVWTAGSRNTTSWENSTTTTIVETLSTESDVARITEDGEPRLIEEVVFTPKNTTEWSEV